MKQYSDYSEIADLLVHSLAGELTPEEKERLEQWRAENGKHESFYQKLHSPSFWENHPQQKYREEIVEAWTRLYQRRNQKRRAVRRLYWGVAAMLAICIGGFVYWHSMQSQIPSGQTLVAQEEIVPGKKQAELVLGDGTLMALNETMSLRSLEEQGAVIKAEDNALQYIDKQDAGSVAYNTLRVPRGGEYSLVLGDGTKVYLNAESELTYPVTFRGESREVSLRGEAFFEVASDHACPFIVRTEQFAVRVLGTQFNVRNYPDVPASATLAEGSIQLSKGKETALLVPGQQASLEDNKLVVREVDLEDAIAWRYGVFSFKHTRLEDLLSELARWYDMEVFYQNPSLKDLHFTAWFQRSDGLEKVISLLEKTQKIDLEVNGKTLLVRSK